MAGDQSPESRVLEFVDQLKARLKEDDRGPQWIRRCEDLLNEINQVLNPSTASGVELLDIAGGCDLLKVEVQYVGISQVCETSVSSLIANIAGTCDPREMFTVFFEAINLYTKPGTLHLCIPLLRGLSIVFRRIRRRQAEFFKEAIPGLLDVGKAALNDKEDAVESGEELSEMKDVSRNSITENVPSKLVDELVNLGKAMRDVLSCEENQRLRDVIIIYILRLLALVSCSDITIDGVIPQHVEDIIKLMYGINFYLKEILTTRQLEEIIDRYADENENNMRSTRFEVRRGAALAVFWGIHDKDSPTSASVFDLMRSQIENSGLQSACAIVNLASVLLVPSGWKEELLIQQKGLALITSSVELFKAVSSTISPVLRDAVSLQILPALKRIEGLIVRTTNSALRKEAYGVLLKIIKELLPAQERYQALYYTISNCDHPSLVSLLLTCVKDEVAKAWPYREMQTETLGNLPLGSAEMQVDNISSPFVSSEVLKFIQCVLRGKDGNPTELPSNTDAVIGALNLYRFLLIRESSGKTNYTHVLFHEELVKGRTYWLLPLREQALRIRSALEEAGSGEEIMLGMNCLLSVLYRCLEIVEQVQKELSS
ncbi:hypothetical protein R1flu_022517 [Riccia fluitans]|uniref:ARM repeat superfamily protein n=1 Tax=Riccia fluitans TaxID=41844 RepID=A0ABD1XPZ8_9MARC